MGDTADVERFLSAQAAGRRPVDQHLFFDPVTGQLVASDDTGSEAIIADQTSEDGYFAPREGR